MSRPSHSRLWGFLAFVKLAFLYLVDPILAEDLARRALTARYEARRRWEEREEKAREKLGVR